MESPPCYSTKTLADRWLCTPHHIRNLVDRGELGYFTIGRNIRIPASEVEKWERVKRNSHGTKSDGMPSGTKTESESVVPSEPQNVVVLTRP